MADSNVEIVKRGFESLSRGDWEASLPLIHPDFEMSTPAELSSEPSTYRGHEGIRRYWESFYEVMDDIRVEAEDFIEVGELVVVPTLLHARGQATGIDTTQRSVQVWELRDEQAIRVSFFADLDQAMAYARERDA